MIGFMLNVDWFNPFKHGNYSMGAIYLSILNLPRQLRFREQQAILVGLINSWSQGTKGSSKFILSTSSSRAVTS